MPMSLTRTTDATTEPITTGEVKAHLRIDDNASDDYLNALISAARQHIEERIGRAIITQTWTLKLDRFPGAERDASGSCIGGRITMPRPRLQSVSSIAYVDTDGTTQTLSSLLYQVDSSSEPGRIAPAYGQSWPTTREQMGAVTVVFVCGYGSTAAYVPTSIIQAMKLLIGSWYESREATLIGTISSTLDFTLDALLGPYRETSVY